MRKSKDLQDYIQKYLEPAIKQGHYVNFSKQWTRLPSYRQIKDWDPNLTVSIVSTCWGNTPVLPTIIEAFAKQDYPRDQFEVLFVDDNSPDKDECIAVMKKLMRKYKDLRLRFFETHKNINWNETRSCNIGIKRAIGDIIVFCSSDVLLVGKDYVTATVKHHSQRKDLWMNPLAYEILTRAAQRAYIENNFRDIDKENFENPSESQLYIINQPIQWKGGSVRRKQCLKLHGLDEGLKGWGLLDGHFWDRLRKDGFVGGQDVTMQTIHIWSSTFKSQYHPQLLPKRYGKDAGHTTGDIVVNPDGWGEIDTLEEITVD